MAFLAPFVNFPFGAITCAGTLEARGSLALGTWLQGAGRQDSDSIGIPGTKGLELYFVAQVGLHYHLTVPRKWALSQHFTRV